MKEILYMMQSSDTEVENCCLIERYFKRMVFSFLEHLSFLENSISGFILKLDRNKIYFFSISLSARALGMQLELDSFEFQKLYLHPVSYLCC